MEIQKQILSANTRTRKQEQEHTFPSLVNHGGKAFRRTITGCKLIQGSQGKGNENHLCELSFGKQGIPLQEKQHFHHQIQPYNILAKELI